MERLPSTNRRRIRINVGKEGEGDWEGGGGELRECKENGEWGVGAGALLRGYLLIA